MSSRTRNRALLRSDVRLLAQLCRKMPAPGSIQRSGCTPPRWPTGVSVWPASPRARLIRRATTNHLSMVRKCVSTSILCMVVRAVEATQAECNAGEHILDASAELVSVRHPADTAHIQPEH
jgi:hypothetical protein